VAELERSASLAASHGSDEDVFATAASLCLLTGSLAGRMRSHGLAAVETPSHRVKLIALPGAGPRYGAVVTELRPLSQAPGGRAKPARDAEGVPPAAGIASLEGGDDGHHRLCPLGGGETRWYICVLHDPSVVFQAGSGHLDAIANSCPRCARLSRSFIGCACEEAASVVDRERRKGRRVRLVKEARPAEADEM
jgi:hypothetical protein